MQASRRIRRRGARPRHAPQAPGAATLAFTLAALVTAAGCAEDPRDPAERQAAHCRAVLAWMVRGAGTADVVGSDVWTEGPVRRVRHVYEYRAPATPGGSPRPVRDTVECTYAAEGPSGADRGIAATAITLKGVRLGPAEVERINLAIALAGGRKI